MRKPLEFALIPDELIEFLEEYKRLHSPRFGPYEAVVKHIVDGDTLDVYCDMGLNDYAYRPVRLKGFNAYERFKGTVEERAMGLKATKFAESVAPSGTPCIFYANEKDRESFGRYEGSIMLPSLRDLTTLLRDAGFEKPL